MQNIQPSEIIEGLQAVSNGHIFSSNTFHCYIYD